MYGLGGSPFYGQFSAVSTGNGGTTTTLTVDGDGAALAGGSGATGTVGATVYTYSGHPVADAALYAYIPTNDSGLFTAYDGSNAITRWSVSGFPASVGSYSCGTDTSLPSVSLTLNGIPYLAVQCSIEIISVSSTEVEGRFAASLVGASNNDFGTVTDGYFRYTVPASNTSSDLAADEYGYSMDVNGSRVTVNNVPALDGFDRQVDGYFTLGDTPTLQLNFIPDGGVGSYSCGSGPNQFRLVAMAYNGYTSTNAPGGSCSIEVTSAGDRYEGSFSATLYSGGGDQMTITNGFFRNDGSQLNTVEQEVTLTAMLDLNDTAFQSAADSAISGFGNSAGSGAIYMDLQKNDDGGDHYGTQTFTMSLSGINGVSGALFFKSGNFMPNTIGFLNTLNQASGDIACVDDIEDIATSGYDVFGYSAYIAPNTLKPFDNNLCVFNIEYDATADRYIGQGSAKMKYYFNTTATDFYRDLRFKFVYKP